MAGPIALGTEIKPVLGFALFSYTFRECHSYYPISQAMNTKNLLQILNRAIYNKKLIAKLTTGSVSDISVVYWSTNCAPRTIEEHFQSPISLSDVIKMFTSKSKISIALHLYIKCDWVDLLLLNKISHV